MNDDRFLIFSIVYPSCNDIASANFNAHAKTLILFLLNQYFIAKISFKLPQRANFTYLTFILHQFFIGAVKISIDIVYKVANLHIPHWSQILKEIIKTKG